MPASPRWPGSKPEPGAEASLGQSDPHFVTAVERTGKCAIKGEAVAGSGIRVRYRLYPPVSVAKHEEGTVVLQLIFDPDWCVRKATVIKSSGYWRLDQVSLDFVMTFKWIPTKPVIIDGEPTVEIPIAGAPAKPRSEEA